MVDVRRIGGVDDIHFPVVVTVHSHVARLVARWAENGRRAYRGLVRCRLTQHRGAPSHSRRCHNGTTGHTFCSGIVGDFRAFEDRDAPFCIARPSFFPIIEIARRIARHAAGASPVLAEPIISF